MAGRSSPHNLFILSNEQNRKTTTNNENTRSGIVAGSIWEEGADHGDIPL